MRQAAQKLGLGPSSYALYENPNTYKKSFLPIDFARKVAAVFADHGISPNDVMKLAGLTETEAEPEAREIESQRPPLQLVSMSVAFPSEAALKDMFESLLALIPAEATRAEAAEILAQRLSSGFAAIGPVSLDRRNDDWTASEAALQFPAKDHHAPARK